MKLWATVMMSVLGMLIVPSALGQQPVRDYTTMIVQAAGASTKATLGAFCHPDAVGGGRCTAEGEVTYPLQGTGTVVSRRGSQVTLLLGAPASELTWRAARIDGRGQERITALGKARAVTKTFKRWRITLPRDLRASSKVLGFDVTYPAAYSSFEVGLRLPSR